MKKKIFFLALALTATTGLFAQKQTGGEKNIEVQFSPLSGNPLSTNGIRFRMFNSESSAIRIGFGLGGDRVTTVRAQATEAIGSTGQTVAVDALYDYESSFNFSIRPGYEMHFDGTDRLSPYVGAELLFGIGRNSFEREFWGGNAADARVENYSVFSLTRTEGTTTVGLNAIAGVDYYIADNLYLGVELGFGLSRTTLRDVEVEIGDETSFLYTDAASADDNFSDVVFVEIADNGSRSVGTREIVGDGSGDWRNFNWGTVMQSTIRLGWLFN